MMVKSEHFMARVEQEIRIAMSGLTNPIVHVHIISGLCGGTGSGCFLDVCYMMRHIAKKIGGAASTAIFGYFFLPDASLSIIPPSYSEAQTWMSRNGYAAMRELDHCMRLPFNGGSFTQTYGGGVKIAWERPPVDMCHLIGGVGGHGRFIENAYDYAINVTAEYVTQILMDPERWEGVRATFHPLMSYAYNKAWFGAQMDYCAIGGVCAYIPLKELNTFLASMLFERFSWCIRKNLPTKDDVEKLVSATALTPRALLQELCPGFGASYTASVYDWKYIRNSGTGELVSHYACQTAAKLNAASQNARSMSSVDNRMSLINRIRKYLDAVICDVDCGPFFAYSLLSDLLKIIYSLLAQTEVSRDQELAQDALLHHDYEQARSDFEESTILYGKKHFERCEHALMVLEEHKLALGCYREMETVLKLLCEQLEGAAVYYGKLNRVMNTLFQTFMENRIVLLDNEETTQQRNAFAVPMMTIGELKVTLDARIGEVDVPASLREFMTLFLEHEDAWLVEDESKIAKLVNSFFVERMGHVFAGFADVDKFLQDKYGVDNPWQLTNIVVSDAWMQRLTDRASPRFWFGHFGRRWGVSNFYSYLSTPAFSYPFRDAADIFTNMENYNTWRVLRSMTDHRILAMRNVSALPLCAYYLCDECEARHFGSKATIGLYSYEGKPVPGMPFNDWRKLPPLTPQSVIHLEQASEPLRQFVTKARELFDQANQAGIFDDENRICAPDPAKAEEIQALAQEARELAAGAAGSSELPALRTMLERLQAAYDIPMTTTDAITVYLAKTGSYTPSDPEDAENDRKTRLSIRKDYFVSSPAYHPLVRGILCQIEELKAALDSAVSAIQCSLEHIEG